MLSLQNKSHYALAVDCVIFGYAQGELKVALIERRNEPFKGSWALPGGFVHGDETAEQAAARELQEETGVHDIYLEQFHVFSEPNRDPRGRVIAVGFFALIASDKIELEATADAADAQWFNAYDLPKLAFDHGEMYVHALKALRNAVTMQPLVFELLPKYFTLTMLQQLYEQIFDTILDKRNFRKQVAELSFIQETKKMTQGGQHRPAKLYRFDAKKYAKSHKNISM